VDEGLVLLGHLKVFIFPLEWQQDKTNLGQMFVHGGSVAVCLAKSIDVGPQSGGVLR
jgi:hypothetical protein